MAYDNGVLIERNTRTGNPDPAAGRCMGRAGFAPMASRATVPLGKHHPDAYTARRDRKAVGKPEPESKGAKLASRLVLGWYESAKGLTADGKDARAEARRLRHARRETAKAAAGNSTVEATTDDRHAKIMFRRRLAESYGALAGVVRRALKRLKLAADLAAVRVVAAEAAENGAR